MSLSRRAIAGLAVAGLAAGVLVGAGTGPLLQAASPDSLAVFDRESTPADELAPGVVTYGPFSASRLLTEFDDVRVFAVRADQNLRTGLDDLGPLICVSAAAPGMEFVPTSCVPEEVFREQGMRGVLRGLAPAGSAGGYRDVERVLSVEWGPRGGPRIVDMTDSAVVALDDLFTMTSSPSGPTFPSSRVCGHRRPQNGPQTRSTPSLSCPRPSPDRFRTASLATPASVSRSCSRACTLLRVTRKPTCA